MRTILKLKLPVFAAMLLTVFGATYVVGQAPPSDPSKTTVIEAIHKRADNHVEGGSPMQTQMVIDLFAKNAAGLGGQEIADIYEQRYLEKANDKRKGDTLSHEPYDWLAAVALLIVGGLIGALHKKIEWLFTSLWEHVYLRVAGMRLFRRISLGHYRKALIDEFTNVRIPFGPKHTPLNLFKSFVPLKMLSASNRQTVDALEVFSRSHRLMIKGPPGAGKSMLLKKVALELAKGGFQHFSYANIPIVMPLHRLGGSDKSIISHVVELLERNRFPRGGEFISKALEKGWLFVLLDGLDEVAEKGRPIIVQQVKDFIQTYRNCRYAVTCRSAVYHGEFDDTLTDGFDILEFTDQQIWKFLHGWDSDLPPEKSIAQLVSSLRDRPSIMSLARNPLMLTIIAHLYCDTEYFILPHSRSEFYKESSDVLLQRWQTEFNRFNPMKKRAILQDLALWVQEESQARSTDRRSMDAMEVQQRVRKQLETLGLKEEHAEAILNEIVERSGLLISIDAGRRYQFAHLTLQEFFAAEALQNNAAGLLGRFRKDRTTWREVVKLWCGVSGDCTDLVNEVNEIDRLTAFECIADARQIDATLVAALIEEFKGELGKDGVSEDTVVAFGLVGSAMHGRGAAIFDFLKGILENDAAPPEQRRAAAEALAMTNLPSAAESLGATLRRSNQFSAQLVRMGDLAVPALGIEADKRNLSALDWLCEIRTPLAARTVLRFLWNNDDRVAVRAALSLGSMLQLPEVEPELGSIRLTEQQRRAPYLDWIWAPFAEYAKPDLGIIVGRIAHLLVLGKNEIVPAISPRVDQRIALPIIAILLRNESCMREEPRTTVLSDREATCALALHRSLDVRMQAAISQSQHPVRGEWETLRYISDVNVSKLWSFWVGCACVAFMLVSSLFIVKDTFAAFAHWEWTTVNFDRTAFSVLGIVYCAYWVMVGIIVFLPLLVILVYSWNVGDEFHTVLGLFCASISASAAFSLFNPFIIVVLTEYAVAYCLCHRPVRERLSEKLFYLCNNLTEPRGWVFIVANISTALSCVGCLLLTYFASIQIVNLLMYYGVGDSVSAVVIAFGIIVLTIACSQRTVYQLVRSENFFREFVLVPENRGAPVKLCKSIISDSNLNLLWTPRERGWRIEDTVIT